MLTAILRENTDKCMLYRFVYHIHYLLQLDDMACVFQLLQKEVRHWFPMELE